MARYGDTPGERIRRRRKELRLDVKTVARDAGLAVSTLYEIENGRQQRTTRMHAICKRLGLRDEYVETGRLPRLVAEPAQAQIVRDEPAKYTLHGMQITSEEVEFGIEWGKLDEPARSLIRQQVMLLVAEQVRRKRATRKSGSEDHPDPEA